MKPAELAQKETELRRLLSGYAKQDVCLAFSGGTDSALLLALLSDAVKEHGTTLYPVTFQTTLSPKADIPYAACLCDEHGVRHIILALDELCSEELRYNPKNRCYLCKKALFTALRDFAAERGCSTIVEGTNEDDLHCYRPGLAAIRELGILSPLAAVHLTKPEIRQLATELGLTAAERPSSPCMATRLPYGTEIIPAVLERIDRGEQYLRSLGFYNVRLRLHGSICRIEVDSADILKLSENSSTVVECLRNLGFHYITVDLQGFRQGSMDEPDLL